MTGFASLTSSGSTYNVIAARVRLPSWGCWSALVTLDRGDVNLAGTVSIAFGPLTLSGTIRRGQGYVGRGQYRVFGGADGWSKGVSAGSYRSPSTLLSTVAKDVASKVGESVVFEPNGDKMLGTYARFAGFASDVLSLYSPGRWWVELDGSTHVGDRASSHAPSVTVLDFDPSMGVATYSDDANFVLPGQAFSSGNVAGTVSTVVHDLDGGKLRSEVYLQ